MATFEITGPDGNKYQVSGETAEGALKALQQHLGGASDMSQERSWADVPAEALQNIPASAKEFGRNLVQPILHPLDTVESLAQLGSGAINNAFPQLAGIDKSMADWGLKEASDPNVVSGQQQLASGVGQFFKDRYGSPEGLKKTIATDPVGAAGDLATVLTGGAAGLARVPGKLANASSKALRVAGNTVNPISAVTKPAGLLAKPVASAFGITTGTGGDAIQEAFRAGERGGDFGKSFLDNMRGAETQESVLHDAHGALGRMRSDRSAEYRRGMTTTRTTTKQIDMTPIEQAFIDVKDTLFEGGLQKTDTATLKKMQEIGKLLDEWKNNPNGTTAIGLDALKQRLDSMMPSFADKTADQVRVITAMRNAVKDTIVNEVPEYASTMKAYEESIGGQKEIERALSLGRNASDDSGLRKLQSIFRNNVNTNYGSRKGNAKKLEAAGADKIMPKLAGQALNSLTPRGLSQLLAGGALTAAWFEPTALAALLATSPRGVGELAHLLGSSKRKIPSAPLASFQAGRASEIGR